MASAGSPRLFWRHPELGAFRGQRAPLRTPVRCSVVLGHCAQIPEALPLFALEVRSYPLLGLALPFCCPPLCPPAVSSVEFALPCHPAYTQCLLKKLSLVLLSPCLFLSSPFSSHSMYDHLKGRPLKILFGLSPLCHSRSSWNRPCLFCPQWCLHHPGQAGNGVSPT